MIQVPSLQVGGLDTGPVWFTQRVDRNFVGYMSQWMDKTVVGALGGNALRNFRILLDYQTAQVHLLAPSASSIRQHVESEAIGPNSPG